MGKGLFTNTPDATAIAGDISGAARPRPSLRQRLMTSVTGLLSLFTGAGRVGTRRQRRAAKARGIDFKALDFGAMALRAVIAVALSTLFAGAAYANPKGGTVTAGAATIKEVTPKSLEVTQTSDKAIVNWKSFSIGADEKVRIQQPSSNSVILNRVTGSDPSAIMGSLSANGTVMLVNPNGVVIGAGAKVDVGGLVATTSNISDANFMAGKYQFDQASAKRDAAVVNEGEITVKDSGLAALVAPHVRNSGVIRAKLGKVALAGAQTFTLDFHGDGLISFDASSAVTEVAKDANGNPVAALVVNSGEIAAEGGSVTLSARAVKGVIDNVINTNGVIKATSVSGSNGKIVLSGGDNGKVVIGGTVDASGRKDGQTGGTVVATGAEIAVAKNTVVDASGHQGGGTVAIGSQPGRAGAWSDKVTVAAGATLSADAVKKGKGGSVTVLSQKKTIHAGKISARGGAEGGDGGFAEVSSHKDIVLTGDIDLSAAKGKAGVFLLDPESLRIVSSAGSQDGAAGDGTISGGDANQGSGANVNTVSKSVLESIASNANIVLEATGLITVETGLNLQTGAGNSFTLRSTTSGGITFTDNSFEIRTNGGAINLLALGIGSTISNVGKLTSQGGNITLTSTGDIGLANAVNAGAGAVSVQSIVGTIRNTAATPGTQLLAGGSVALSAAGASIGSGTAAINTRTTALALETGGGLNVVNDATLGSLGISSVHAAPGTANSYQVASTGLTFNVTDGAGGVSLNTVSQNGLNFSFTADSTLALGTVNLGNGSLSLASTGGSLSGTGSTLLTAGTLTLSAKGSTGTNGAIGTSGQAINTDVASLTASAGSGGVYVRNAGALTLANLTSTGGVGVTSGGTMTVGTVASAGQTVALASTNGSILDDGVAGTAINAYNLSLNAGGSIGTASTAISTSAPNLSANAGNGGVYANLAYGSGVTLTSVLSGNGAIAITSAGSLTANTVVSGTSSVSNGISLTATTGNLSVGTVNAGSSGDVTLTARSGSVTSAFGGLVTGNRVTATAEPTMGGVTLNTAANSLSASAGYSGITITQTGDVTLAGLTVAGLAMGGMPIPSNLTVTASGTITIGGTVASLPQGAVSLISTGGSILGDGNAANVISAGTLTLSAAAGSIGSAAGRVQTNAPAMTLASQGNIYVDNAQSLTSLAVTANHAGNTANTYSITAPYLTWTSTDDGSRIALQTMVGTTLTAFNLTSDKTIVAGRVQTGTTGSISLTSTGGDLLDDGDRNTRVSGNTLTLTSSRGSIGADGTPLDVNSTTLTLNTAGNLYVADVADIATLTVASTHGTADANYGYLITAPSMTWNVTDSSNGFAINTLTDSSGLTLTLTSDRSIILGSLDITRSGTLTLTSSAGNIQDDGVAATQTLAGTIKLTASSGAIGDGTNAVTLAADSITTTSGNGDTYIAVSTPLNGGTNKTSAVQYTGNATGGGITVTARHGDLLIGRVTTGNRAITLTAAAGSINPYATTSMPGMPPTVDSLITSNGGTITLTASGGIGNANALLFGSAGTVNASAAGGPVALTSSGSGLRVGTINAGTNTATLTANSGSITDDGNISTGITAGSVTLSAANGSVGSSGTLLTVTTGTLTVSSAGSIGITDTMALSSLTLNSTNTSWTSGFTVNASNLTFSASDTSTLFTLSNLTATSPLAFSLSSGHAITATNLNTRGGNATLTAGSGAITLGTINSGSGAFTATATSGNIVNNGTANAKITAGTVSLTAGNGSIGDDGTNGTLALSGVTGLTAVSKGDIRISDDTALTSLALTSTATTAAANVIAVTAPGQTYSITDDGNYTQTLTTVSGPANFSFTSAKNIAVGSVNVGASGTVALTSSGNSVNGNRITMASGGSAGITASTVALTATSGYTDTSSIGTSGTALKVSASSLSLSTSGGLYIASGRALSALDITTKHNTYSSTGVYAPTSTYTYAITGTSGLSSFSITDTADYTALNNIVSTGALNFSFTADRQIRVGTITAGTSSTGSVTLASTGSAAGLTIEGSSGTNRITAGTVSLTANGSYSGIGGTTAINTTTSNLALNSGGHIRVANSANLASLSLTESFKSGSGYTFSITSTGLTSGISYDTLYGLRLTSIISTGGNLALTVNANSTVSVGTIDTGAGGSVSITAGTVSGGVANYQAIQGMTSSSRITTGDLTLNASVVGVYSSSSPFLTTASSLSGTVSNTMNLSNTGNLMLKGITATNSASIATSGAMTSDGISTVTAGALSLTAGSMGTPGTALRVDTPNLTLTSGGNVYVAAKSDLVALTLTSNHAAPQANVLQITAPQLTFNVTDNGTQFDLANVTDTSGLDFSFTGDRSIKLGVVNGQYGRPVSITSTNGSLTADSTVDVTGGILNLTATGSIGTAGNHLKTNTPVLNLSSGADIYVDNSLDLSALSLTTTQTGATGGSFVITSGAGFGSAAPTLTFAGNDDGTYTNIDTLIDSTGLTFTANTQHSLKIGTINVAPSSTQTGGSVSLTSANSILGASASNHITAAQTSITNSTAGNIGAAGTALNLSSPLVTLNIKGDLYLASDTHIDSLSIDSKHPGSTYGTYNVTSAGLTFSATDDAAGTHLANIVDTAGLALTFTSDRSIIVGTIDLGTTGTAALSNNGGSIVGDGDTATRLSAASVTLTSNSGAVGTTGTGNEIDVQAGKVEATARGGGINLGLTGGTSFSSLTSAGDIRIAKDNSAGDIALGSIQANGHDVYVDNQGGSIVSGSLSNTRNVTLIAQGSIGNVSAIQTSASSGTTVLTAVANTNGRGATGSVNISESYGLNATSITAPGAITLKNGQGTLSVGTIGGPSGTAAGAVSVTAGQGSIVGNAGNSINASSVTLSANYSNATSIGSSTQAINVTTPDLTLKTSRDIYVNDTSALTNLTIDRTPSSGSTSGGIINLSASGLTASITDAGSTVTLANITAYGLNLSYKTTQAISVGTINLGSTGSLTLTTAPTSGSASITASSGSSQVTAGTVSLTAGGTASSIGNSSQALQIAVSTMSATAGTGGIYLSQAGDITLSNLSSGGALSVSTTNGGNITLGQVSYGNGQALTLNAAGSIYSGGYTIYGSASSGGTYGAINLTAVSGIGTAAAPVTIYAPGNGITGNAVSATVTGTGNINIASAGSLPGGITTSAANGSTTITSAGSIKVTSATSGTDRAGNGISVLATSGDITFGTITAGAANGQVSLTANSGRVLSSGSSSSISAFAIDIDGAAGVGDSNAFGLNAIGQRVEVTSRYGAIKLTPQATSTLAYVATNGGTITIAAGADVYVGNALSNGGAITITSGSHTVYAGNINAGSGAVTINAGSAGGAILDDGLDNTRIVGGSVTLTGNDGVGTAARAVQTTANSLTLMSNTGGVGIYVDDNNANGVTLNNVRARSGAVVINTAGPTIATSVTADSDSAGNDITIAVANGDLTVGTVSAGTTNGRVTLTSTTGAIKAAMGSGTNVTARTANLYSATGIGTLTNFATGAGAPIVTAVGTLSNLASTGAGSVINVRQTGNLILGTGTTLTLGTGATAYLQATGNIDASSGVPATGNGDLALLAGGTLTLPSSGFTINGNLYLSGTTDVVSAGVSPRTVAVSANSVKFRSGSAGGDTVLNTTTGALDAALTGTTTTANLTASNTGSLSNLTLATAKGSVAFTNSTGFTANSVTANGTNPTVSLTATTGNLTVGTVSAGATGTVNLTATAGSLMMAGSGAVTAGTLNLTSLNAIGSTAQAFTVASGALSANVTGTGGIYLATSPAVTLGNLTTANGDVVVTGPGTGTLVANGGITAGGNSAITLTNNGGAIAVSGSMTGASLTAQAGTISVGAMNTTGAQIYTGNTTFTGDVTASAVTVTGNLTLAGGNRTVNTSGSNGAIGVTGTLAGGNLALTLNAGTGTITLGSVASGLTTLTATGGSIVTAGVASTGNQSYNGAATLSGIYSAGTGTITVTGPATLAANTTLSAGTVTLTGGADAATDGGQSLTILGNLGAGGTLGGTRRLNSLSVTGTSALNGAVTTAGTQTYSGAVTLGGDTTLTGSTVTLTGPVNGARTLTIAGNGVLTGTVGGSTALTGLSVSGTSLLGGAVTTSGAQTYTGPVTLAANTILTGSAITLAGTVNGAYGLTVAGNATLGGAVGGTAALTSLSVTGTSALNGGSVATSVNQTYGGAVTLGNDATLTSGAGGVIFVSTVDGAKALTVNSTGATLFNDAVGGATALTSLTTDADGTTSLKSVRTTGAQTYNDATTLNGTYASTDSAILFNAPVTLAGDSVVNAGYGTITFNGTVDGAKALTVNSTGAMQFYGSVGGTTALASLTSGSGYTSLVNVTTSGAQSYGGQTSLIGTYITNNGAFGVTGPVTLAGDTVVSTGSGNVTFAGTVDGAHIFTFGLVNGGRALTVNSTGTTLFSGAVGGATALASLTTDAGGTTSLKSVRTTGTQTYNDATTLNGTYASTDSAITFNAPVTLGGDTEVNAGYGTIAFNGTVDGAKALTVNSTGAMQFYGSVGGTTALASLTSGSGYTSLVNVTTSGAQSYGGETSLIGTYTTSNGTFGVTGPVTLAGDTVVSTGSGNVTFAGTVDGAHIFTFGLVNGGRALTVNSTGTTLFSGAVGGTTALASLTTDAGGTTSLKSVRTTGAQTYNDATTLDGTYASTDSAITFNGPVTLAGDTVVNAGAGNVAFLRTVDGARALTVNSSGATRFDGTVGGTTALASLITDAEGTTRLKSVNTTGTQSYQDAVTLDGVYVVAPGGTFTASGPVTLGGTTAITAGTITVASTLDGAQALTLTGGAGGVALRGAVGGITRLGALTVNGAGTTVVNGVVKAASLTTDAGGRTVLNSGLIDTTGTQSYGDGVILGADTVLKGSTVALAAGADATGPGAQSLTVDGNAALAQGIGATAALKSLTVGGATRMNGGSIVTSGAQSYGGAVTLANGAETLTSGADGIVFASTLDGGQNLTLNSGLGDVTFAGTIGGNARLGDLTVTSGGRTRFAGAVKAASVTTDAAGTLALDGGSVDTTGTQSYGERLVLSTDTVLTGSAVTLASTVDATEPGAQALTIAGDAVLNGAVGGAQALRTLTVTGGSRLNGGTVTTRGAQSFSGAVELGADTILTGGTVALLGGGNAPVAGAQSLTINGDAVLAGAFGSARDLRTLSVNGAARLNGGSVTTAGAQTFAGAATVAGDTTLSSLGGDLVFGSSLDAANRASLTLAAANGNIRTVGVVGGLGALGDLTVLAGNSVLFDRAVTARSVRQTGGGATRFGGALTADGAAGIQLTGASFTFDAPVIASAGALSIANTDPTGTVTFAADANLVTATGFTQAGGSGIVLPGSITVANGPITLGTVATLPVGKASITTNGAITMAGLQGANTSLTMASGSGGAMVVGLENLNPLQKINVLSLTVPTAGSARMYGSVAGKNDALAASIIDSPLRAAPYFINNAPWGPTDTVNRVAATVVVDIPVPSTPGVTSLFTGRMTSAGLTPNALDAFTDPRVLTVSGTNPGQIGAGAQPSVLSTTTTPTTAPAGKAEADTKEEAR